jgi:PAS domain S-box-containing protein
MQQSQFSADWMGRIVEAAPNAVLMVDARGHIQLANAQAEKLFGYTRPELLGQSMEILIPERLRAGHAGLRADFFQNPTPRSMGGGRDLFGRRKDGTEVPIEIGLNPVHTGDGVFVVASLVDISRRKQAEEALLRERNLLRTLIDQLPDYIFVKDTRRCFVTANAAMARLMGVTTPEELVGKSDEDFYPEHAAGEFRSDEERVLRGEPITSKDEPHTDHEGRVFEILTTKLPLRDAAGHIIGLVGISRDVTQFKLKELALHEALDQVRTLRGLLPICAFCHKIRNPDGSWEQLESYISGHTDANFTHGYCPDCIEEHYGGRPD